MKFVIIPSVSLIVAVIIFLFSFHVIAGLFGLVAIWCGWQIGCELEREL